MGNSGLGLGRSSKSSAVLATGFMVRTYVSSLSAASRCITLAVASCRYGRCGGGEKVRLIMLTGSPETSRQENVRSFGGRDQGITTSLGHSNILDATSALQGELNPVTPAGVTTTRLGGCYHQGRPQAGSDQLR
jgi:hypothetical protein